MLETGALDPAALITRRVGLQEGADLLMTMAEKPEPGIAVITAF
jgi:threonine dehydrogenase-like Zn-dependent dehydrogenase